MSLHWYIRYTGGPIRINSTEGSIRRASGIVCTCWSCSGEPILCRSHIARWLVVRCSMLVARYCFAPSLARCSIWSAKPSTHHLLPLPAIRKMPVVWVNCQVFDVTADSWVSPSDLHTIKSEDTNPYYAIPICTCKWT